jgi:hypothetical protein
VAVEPKQEIVMATYDPPQPMWKRNLAGILDFFLALFVCAYVVLKIFGNRSDAPDVLGKLFFSYHSDDAPYYGLGGWPVLLAFALVVAYFVILGQTGGTVFQRLFGMKRVTFWR